MGRVLALWRIERANSDGAAATAAVSMAAATDRCATTTATALTGT